MASHPYLGGHGSQRRFKPIPESYQLATYRQGLQPLPLLSRLRLGCSQTVPATLPGCLVASLSRS